MHEKFYVCNRTRATEESFNATFKNYFIFLFWFIAFYGDIIVAK